METRRNSTGNKHGKDDGLNPTHAAIFRSSKPTESPATGIGLNRVDCRHSSNPGQNGSLGGDNTSLRQASTRERSDVREHRETSL